MSIWLAAVRLQLEIEVLSYGARKINKTILPSLSKIAAKYTNVAIIADDPADAQANAYALKLEVSCQAIANPKRKDPNDLLLENRLENFLLQIQSTATKEIVKKTVKKAEVAPSPPITDKATATDELFELIASVIALIDTKDWRAQWHRMEETYSCGNATDMWNLYHSLAALVPPSQTGHLTLTHPRAEESLWRMA